MSSVYLVRISLVFSGLDKSPASEMLAFLRPLGQIRNQQIKFSCSAGQFYPVVCLEFQPGLILGVTADFVLSDNRVISATVENITGETRRSPHTYEIIALAEVQRRLAAAEIGLVGIDHAGFNLPWLGPGLHPTIARLRQQLSEKCLYHHFPTGEPWDFILPGDLDEISRFKMVDYGRNRRPKFEVVSFEKASTPLVQFDLQLDANYEALRGLFPEALDDPEFRNLWIYLENPYGIDVCLVANEAGEGDWSDFFAGSRLQE